MKHAAASLVILVVAASSLAVVGSSLRVTVGTSLAVSVWQTSPRIYSDSTKWGGLGLDLAFGFMSMGVSVTITDFESLTIAERPSFSLGISAAPLRLGPVNVGTGCGLMVTPSTGFCTVSGSVFVKWFILRNTSVSLGITLQTTLPWAPSQGTTLNIGIGATYYYRLF